MESIFFRILMSPVSWVLVHKLRSFPVKIWNCPLNTEDKERPKKEAEHCRMVDGRFNIEGTYTWGFSLMATRQISVHTWLLKVYIEALMGLCQVYHLNDLNTLLSQGCVVGAMSSAGKASRTPIPRTGERVRNLWLPRPSNQSKFPHPDWPVSGQLVVIFFSWLPPTLGNSQENC